MIYLFFFIFLFSLPFQKKEHMKKLYTIGWVLLFSTSVLHAQTIIYKQTFNSGSASDWTLNTADEGGTTASGDNEWVINNIYTGGTLTGATPNQPAAIVGAPNSYYLHIYSQLGIILGQPANDNFDAAGTMETYFVAQTTPVSTVGYSNVYFSFWWLCQGDAASSGKLYYKTSSGGSWTQITTPIATFYGSGTWAVDSFHMAAFDGQAFLEFGFQFEDGDASGLDPAFGIDDITLTGTPGAAVPVASITATATSTCVDSCVTAMSASTGTVDSVRWMVTPAGPAIAAATSDTTSICFTTSGEYSVSLIAINTAGRDTATTVFTVNPVPSPVITKAGHVLSVPNLYTSYQWYSDATAITGANTYTYTYTTEGPTYSVVVDSAGCPGTSSLISTLGITHVNKIEGNYYLVQSGVNALICAVNPLPADVSISVLDESGRVVKRINWVKNSTTTTVYGDGLADGLYIIKITGEGLNEVMKWVK